MPLPTIWNTTVTPGAAWRLTVACRDDYENPLPLATKTLSLVIRPSTADATQPALVKVTSAGATAQGSVTVDPTAGLVSVVVLPAATILLAGQPTWAYGLWENPASDADPLVAGMLTTLPVALP